MSALSVRHTRTFFGAPLWRRVYALEDSDTASVDVIEDTIFLTQRPRWYTLSLWSSALSKDLVVMRSNDPEELRRIASILNAAIADVRAKAVRLGSRQTSRAESRKCRAQRRQRGAGTTSLRGTPRYAQIVLHPSDAVPRLSGVPMDWTPEHSDYPASENLRGVTCEIQPTCYDADPARSRSRHCRH